MLDGVLMIDFALGAIANGFSLAISGVRAEACPRWKSAALVSVSGSGLNQNAFEALRIFSPKRPARGQ